MGIESNYTKQQFLKLLHKEAEKRKAALVRTMLYCAEEITNKARSTNSYTDRTGNLRSSVGAIVILDGKVVREYGFTPTTLQGSSGASEGKDLAHSLTSQYPKGVAIVVVAGKEYASYVADKGYDVLDSAEQLAKKIVPELLTQLDHLLKQQQ